MEYEIVIVIVIVKIVTWDQVLLYVRIDYGDGWYPVGLIIITSIYMLSPPPTYFVIKVL